VCFSSSRIVTRLWNLHQPVKQPKLRSGDVTRGGIARGADS
jgi:hypothetical protein